MIFIERKEAANYPLFYAVSFLFHSLNLLTIVGEYFDLKMFSLRTRRVHYCIRLGYNVFAYVNKIV